MAITPDDLQSAAALLASASSVREAAATWRSRHPEHRVVVVDAMDMRGEAAALHCGARSIYLATSNGHCWSTTEQPEEATALILTQD
jgi:DNA-binding IclR family transcriptional regulator